MRSPARAFGGTLALSLLIACGPPPEANVPGAGATAAPSAPSAERGEVADDAPFGAPAPSGGGVHRDLGDTSVLDRSPVPEPADVLAHVRWNSMGATLATLSHYAKLPSGFVNTHVRNLLTEVVKEALWEQVDPSAFADVIAVDAPMDVIIAFEASRIGPPQPLGAVSIGLVSLQRAANASKHKLNRVGPGLWRIGSEEAFGPRCLIAAAGGATEARLICGESGNDVAKLAPYMARTLPTQAGQRSDLHAELRLKELARRFGKQAQDQIRGLPVLAKKELIGIKKFDDALMDAAVAIADDTSDLIFDLDRVTFDLTLDKTKGMIVEGNLMLAGKKSWFAQTMVDGASRSGPAPDMFWSVPKEASTVSYNVGADPLRYNKTFRILQALLEGALEKEKIGTAADRRALADLLTVRMKKPAAAVGATGQFAGATSSGNTMTDILNGTIGWQIYGMQDGPAATKGFLTDLVATYNRPTLQALLKKALGSDAKMMPEVRTVAAPRQLGPGAMAVEIKVDNLEDPMAAMGPTGGSPATMTVTAHMLVMADGADRTWVGLALDRDKLADLMASMKGTAGPGSLNTRSDLGMFRSGRHVSGGFTSLDALLDVVDPVLSAMTAAGMPSAEIARVRSILASLPHKGSSPIVFVADADAGSAPGVAMRLTIPGATFEDIGHIASGALQMFQDITGGP